MQNCKPIQNYAEKNVNRHDLASKLMEGRVSKISINSLTAHVILFLCHSGVTPFEEVSDFLKWIPGSLFWKYIMTP